MPEPRLLIAVCTYNEMANLPELTEKIRHHAPYAHMLIVDDDSPDGTGRWATEFAEQNPPVVACVRKNQRGLGSAITYAMQYAIDQDFDYIINLDADFSHDPADIPRLLTLAQSENASVVVGSRYVKGGEIRGWPIHRKMLSAILNAVATRLLSLPVRDCSGAFRCYQVSELAKLDPRKIRSTGYAMLEEVLFMLHNQKATMVEIPICFHDRELGKSKLNFREALRSAWAILTLRLRKPRS